MYILKFEFKLKIYYQFIIDNLHFCTTDGFRLNYITYETYLCIDFCSYVSLNLATFLYRYIVYSEYNI